MQCYLNIFYIPKKTMSNKLSIRHLHTFSKQNCFPKPASLSKQIEQSKRNPFTDSRQMPTRDSPITNRYFGKQADLYTTKVFGKGKAKFETEYQMPHKFGRKTKENGSLALKDYNCEHIIYLLKYEKDCIERMKKIVGEDNVKIEEHFEDFKKSITNMVDDLKLSIKAHIDSQYQHFIDQFKVLKMQFSSYCKLKENFWEWKNQGTPSDRFNDNLLNSLQSHCNETGKKLSNDSLVASLMQDIQTCRKHIKYEEFSKVQESVLKPILHQAEEMTQQLSIESYYQPQIAHSTFQRLYGSVEKQFHKMYDKMDLFITDYLSVREKERKEENIRENPSRSQKKKKVEGKIYHRNHVTPSSHTQLSVGQRNHLEEQIKDQFKMTVSKSESEIKREVNEEVEAIYEIKRNFEVEKYKEEGCTDTAADTFESNKSSKKHNSFIMKNEAMYAPDGYRVGRNSQSGTPTLMFDRSRDTEVNSPQIHIVSSTYLKLEQREGIIDQSNKYRDDVETALCIVALPHLNKMVVGTKNGSIKIFCLKTGAKLKQLLEHKSSVCTLQVIKGTSTVFSGGDIGCCRLISWNFEKEDTSEFMKILPKKHSAAVTSILDLEDGKHVVSGSFDSTVNVYNMKNQQVTKCVNTGEKVTELVLLKTDSEGWWDKKKTMMVMGHLNNSISIWQVCRNSFNSVTGLEQSRKIGIGAFPQSIRWVGSKIYVSGKDKWLRIIDSEKAVIDWAEEIPEVCYQMIEINNKNVICILRNGDICVLRENKELLKIGENSGMSFSCGINPKSLIIQNALYLVNQKNTTSTEVNKWVIQ